MEMIDLRKLPAWPSSILDLHEQVQLSISGKLSISITSRNKPLAQWGLQFMEVSLNAWAWFTDGSAKLSSAVYYFPTSTPAVHTQKWTWSLCSISWQNSRPFYSSGQHSPWWILLYSYWLLRYCQWPNCLVIWHITDKLKFGMANSGNKLWQLIKFFGLFM